MNQTPGFEKRTKKIITSIVLLFKEFGKTWKQGKIKACPVAGLHLTGLGGS
jgi:hypothetical protein